MFGIVDGTHKRGRPCKEWMDDIVSWCKTGLQELNSLAQDRRRRKLITRQEMDTNGCQPIAPEEKKSVKCHQLENNVKLLASMPLDYQQPNCAVSCAYSFAVHPLLPHPHSVPNHTPPHLCSINNNLLYTTNIL